MVCPKSGCMISGTIVSGSKQEGEDAGSGPTLGARRLPKTPRRRE